MSNIFKSLKHTDWELIHTILESIYKLLRNNYTAEVWPYVCYLMLPRSTNTIGGTKIIASEVRPADRILTISLFWWSCKFTRMFKTTQGSSFVAISKINSVSFGHNWPRKCGCPKLQFKILRRSESN